MPRNCNHPARVPVSSAGPKALLYVALVAFLIFLSAIGHAQASEIVHPEQLQDSYNYASNYPGVLWIQGHLDDGTNDFFYYFSGFVLGALKAPDGTVLKTYVAVPMHAFIWTNYGENFPVLAGTGNYKTQNGALLTNLAAEYISPLWDPADIGEDTPGDIAVFSSPTAVPDSWVHPLAPVNYIPYPGFDQQLNLIGTSIGYGFPSTPNGILPSTGDPMAFKGYMDTSLPINMAWDENHLSIEMYPYDQPYLNGHGTSGDSGSIVLDDNGYIIGMTVAGDTNPTDQSGSTQFNNFMAQAFHSQVAPYAGIQFTGPPRLSFSLAATNLILTWPSPCVLQEATNAAGPFQDLAAATSPHTNSMTLSQEYFRLRLPSAQTNSSVSKTVTSGENASRDRTQTALEPAQPLVASPAGIPPRNR